MELNTYHKVKLTTASHNVNGNITVFVIIQQPTSLNTGNILYFYTALENDSFLFLFPVSFPGLMEVTVMECNTKHKTRKVRRGWSHRYI